MATHPLKSTLAVASQVNLTIDLAAVPLSDTLQGFTGTDRAARIAAATAGDDYELLFAAPIGWAPPVRATQIGDFTAGNGLTLRDGGCEIPLPSQLGYLHP